MTQSIDVSERIDNQMGGLSWASTFHYPTPVTDEDWKWQHQAVEALDQAQGAWHLALNLLGSATPVDFTCPGILNSELATMLHYFHCFKHAPFPPRGENPAVDTLLDLVERALERTAEALRKKAKTQ